MRRIVVTSFGVAVALLGGTHAAQADELKGGCAKAGGYELTSTEGVPRWDALDREIGNADGFVCVKTLPGNQEPTPGTWSIIDNRVQGKS